MLLRPVLRPVLREPFRSPFKRGSVGFAVAMLFAANEPGVHFETYNPDSLLQRRNLFTYSEQFDNATWPSTGATIAADAVAAPDGTITADKLVESAAGSGSVSHMVQYTGGGTPIGAFRTVTMSVYVKAAGRSKVQIADLAGFFSVAFDLTAVTATPTLGTGTIVDAGNGWFRISATAMMNAAAHTPIIRLLDATGATAYVGDGASGAYVWGAQFEVAPVASTYQKVTDWYTEYMAAALTSIGMWQDNLGQQPVTAVEQTVGLWFDSKRGIVYGADIAAGKTFSTASANTACAGLQTTFSGASSGAIATSNLAMTSSVTYEVTYQITGFTQGGINMLVGGGVRTANGTYTERVAPGGTLSCQATGTPTTAVVTVISVKPIPGSHALQGTAGSRPKLSARYNLLTKTEQFDDAAWTKSNTGVTPNAAAAPDGTQSADKLIETAVTAAFSAQQNTTFVAGAPHTVSVRLKAAERNFAWIGVSGGAASLRVAVDLTTGAFSAPVDAFGNYGGVSTASTALGNGWWLVTLTATRTAGGSDTGQVSVGIANSLAVASSYAGTAGSGIYVWGADQRTTNDAALNQPAYQRVNTATDYDTAGFIHYLKYDGIDDSFVTPAIDFSGVNKMTVWTGAMKLSDAAVGVLAELTAGASSTDGGFYVAGPVNAAQGNYGFATRGTIATSTATAAGFSAPVSNLLCAQYDNAAATNAAQNIVRVDGAQQVLVFGAGPTTAANFANTALNIGRRNNASLPFNGRMTSLTVRGSTTPASTTFIKSMEQYAAKLAGQTFVST